MKKALEIIFWSIVLICGALYSTETYKKIAISFYGASLVFFFLASFYRIISTKKIEIVKGARVPLFAWGGAIISMTISSIINSERELFLGTLFMASLSLYLLVYGVSLLGIAFSTLISFVVVTVLNLVSGLSFPFEGIFHNPNSLGGFYATLSFLAAGVLSEKVTRSKFFAFAFVFIILSSSGFSLITIRIKPISVAVC